MQPLPGKLAALAQRIKPAAEFDALAATPALLAQLRAIEHTVSSRHAAAAQTAPHSKRPAARGITAAFVGTSASRKFLAAEAIAKHLGMDLLRIDLAGVASKYIGETEKNIDRLLAAAERADVVLFFDEAEALFGKRTNVHDSHDRYASAEISTLLDRLDGHDGLAILTTDLDGVIAPRLTFRVDFSVLDGATPAPGPTS
jgi:hypothetical protein